MVSRDSIAWASTSTLIVAFGSSFGSSASAAPHAPFRAPLAEAPPPIVQILAAERARVLPVALVPPEPFSPIAGQSGAAARANLAAETGIDIAEALIDDDRRAFADTLGRWIEKVSGERRARRRAIADAYAHRAYRPLWRDGESWRPEAAAALARLHEAGEDGLDLSAYPLPAIGDRAATEAEELALSEAVVAYAAQAAGGRVDPQRVSRQIGARQPLPEAGATLAAVTQAGAGAGEALLDFNPQHSGYRALRAKLAELRTVGLPEIEWRYAEARSVARSDAAPAGKSADAVAPPKRSRSRVEAEIIANMERWRWLPRDLGETRIEVNIPDFQLAVVRDGEVSHRARVIVGKEGTPTPVFSNRMQFIIVNPYWNVPPSILNKEMLPKYGGDLQAIAASGYEVVYRRGRPLVRQRPGEGNALGRIKFMFPNDFSVYLHDTPSRSLFAATHRAFSHGCVRVDQPFRLAEAVLGPGSGWPEDRVRKLIGGSERYITLSQPLPIHIEYFTAYVDERGRLQLRGDLYGYSAKVRQALGLDG
jgi:murein L,D-transpeptidase YcbB/YkuD